MWAFLILPDCRGCDVRKASDWSDLLCHPCRGEVELLEGLWSLLSPPETQG